MHGHTHYVQSDREQITHMTSIASDMMECMTENSAQDHWRTIMTEKQMENNFDELRDPHIYLLNYRSVQF